MRRLYEFGGLVLIFGMVGFLLAGCAYQAGAAGEPIGTNVMAQDMGGGNHVRPGYNDGDHDSDDRGSSARSEGHMGGFGGGHGGGDGDGDGDGGGHGGDGDGGR